MTQEEYIEILVNKAGWDRRRRNYEFSDLCHHEIKYINDMDVLEKSKVIDYLKEITK